MTVALMTAQTAALLSCGARLQQQQRLLRANVFATTLASVRKAMRVAMARHLRNLANSHAHS